MFSRSTSILLVLAVACTVRASEPTTFRILVQREKTENGLVFGKLFINGEALGTCYEPDHLKVPAGVHPAHLRTESGKNHVVGPGGVIGKKGDFMVELDPVKQGNKMRTYIQFHGGNKVEHSLGCILCGPVARGKNSELMAPEPLRKMRLLFHDGNDNPKGTPNKKIVVEIRDPQVGSQ
jgi:Family of unknown function (DUF5675)